MCCEATLLSEIEMKEIKRDHLALTYALAIRSEENVDYAKVNKAIMHRWSRAGLNYIKHRAWGILEGKIKIE